MGQRQKQPRSSDAEIKQVLVGLDTQISHLDTQIAAFVSSKNDLEQARDYILSLPTNNPQHTNGSAGPSSGLPMAQQSSLPFLPAKKAPSSLRQQAMIRNALERDKSPTPPAGSVLLSSDEFEAAFGDGRGDVDDGKGGGNGINDRNGDVRMSVEEETTTTTNTRFTRSMTTVSDSSSRNVSPASETNTSSANGQGAHWEAKRATKRKLQENASKAREARRRKLGETGRGTV
jgi:hypothetical protein